MRANPPTTSILVLVAVAGLLLGGCYSRQASAIAPAKATAVLERDGFHPKTTGKVVDSEFAWQRPNNAVSTLCFGLIFTRHRVENGEVVSETYGWSLLPGLFGILPGFLVNIPIPLQDETQLALTREKN